MTWLYLSVGSAVLLGIYDVAKKQALRRNGVLYVLLGATALTALIMSPFLSEGSLHDHLCLVLKAVLVTVSWVSGLQALKTIPLTTASTIKASRPIFVVAFSIILFGERLNLWQWAGVILVIAALFLLSLSSRKEGIVFTRSRGVLWILLSVLTGAASALYDKHILRDLQPLFVQSWSNVYITVLLALCVLLKALHDGAERERFHWDWTLVLVAVLISGADAMYFFALKQGDALLSVVSMIRRSAVVITFALGAILFKENHIKSKALDLGVLLVGIALLLFGSAIA